MKLLNRILPLIAAASIIACDSPTTDPGPDPDLVSASIVAGNNQSAAPAALLGSAIRIRVVKGANTPVAGRAVTWTVATGGGTLTETSATTNAAGEATARWTLGPNPGVQTVKISVADIAGQLTATATATTPGQQQQPVLVGTVPVPANYGIHDTFVRDGIAFVMAWNSGVKIYDVGGGGNGGTPNQPLLISTVVTSINGVPGGPQAHNAWWFHNPVTQEKKYLFVGQEGPASVGSTSSGDIHIVDVSNMAAPVEVGFIRVAGAGAHNFWMDEARQILYAAFYNGGVAAIDVSGNLAGDMSSRIVTRVQPGGPSSTYVWGVMLAGNTLFASDMESGFWALDPITLATRGGGLNANSRFTSDLWVAGSWGYTGTWGTRSGNRGNAINVWSIAGNGTPTLQNTLLVDDVGTISDVAVTADGKALVATAEGFNSAGLLIYDRADPANPQLRARVIVPQGLHTGELAVIGGKTYVFGARNPGEGGPALVIYDITGVVP